MLIRPTTVAFLLTLLVPPAFYVAFAASSMSLGLAVCAIFWTFVGLATGNKPFTLQRSDAYRLAAVLAGVLLLAVHVSLNELQLGGVDFGRFASSCAFLLVVFIGAHFAAKKLMHASARDLVGMADAALVCLTILGLAAVAGVPPIGPQASVKAVVIFGEPSHFALAYVPMLLFRAAIAKRTTQFLLVSAALVLAVLLQSLTMVAGLLVVSSLLLRRTPMVLMLAAVAIGAATLDLTYYSERLNFSSESDNISTLVFMQGWQNAILNFRETHGLGVGFQQFGIAGSIGDIADKIATLLGEYISLLDGGSTATKLIAEFGVLGIVALLVFLRIVFRGVLFVRRAQFQNPAHRDQRTLFYYSLLVSYSFELLIRGVGYFSPGGFLALVALLALSRERKARELSRAATADQSITSSA